MRRSRLVQEILQHAKAIHANTTTIIFLLAATTDRELTKFHREFMLIEDYKLKPKDEVSTSTKQ